MRVERAVLNFLLFNSLLLISFHSFEDDIKGRLEVVGELSATGLEGRKLEEADALASVVLGTPGFGDARDDGLEGLEEDMNGYVGARMLQEILVDIPFDRCRRETVAFQCIKDPVEDGR